MGRNLMKDVGERSEKEKKKEKKKEEKKKNVVTVSLTFHLSKHGFHSHPSSLC